MSQKIPIVKCKQCGVLFQQWDGDPKKSHRRRSFCTRKCQFNSFKKPITGIKKCTKCGKDMPFRDTLKVRSYGGVYSINSKYCSRPCLLNSIRHLRKSRKGVPNLWMRGRKRSKESIEKGRQATLGPKHWNWKGGISPKNNAERSCIELKEWRRQVFSRDNYTCQKCGYRGKGLEVDHIKEWANYPELRFILSNGRTLCKPCHSNTPNYRGRINKKISTPSIDK